MTELLRAARRWLGRPVDASSLAAFRKHLAQEQGRAAARPSKKYRAWLKKLGLEVPKELPDLTALPDVAAWLAGRS